MTWLPYLPMIIAMAASLTFIVVLLDKCGKLSLEISKLKAEEQRAWGLTHSVADTPADRRLTVSDTAYLARVHAQRLTPVPVTRMPVYKTPLRLPTT